MILISILFLFKCLSEKLFELLLEIGRLFVLYFPIDLLSGCYFCFQHYFLEEDPWKVNG